MYPAQAASYSTFVPPYSYVAMFKLLQTAGLMSSDGLCNPDADLYDAIVCPPHSVKVTKNNMAAYCQQSSVSQCPQVIPGAKVSVVQHSVFEMKVESQG